MDQCFSHVEEVKITKRIANVTIFFNMKLQENIFLTVLRNLSYNDLQGKRKCICSDQLLLVFTKLRGHSKMYWKQEGFDKKVK